MFDVMIEWMGYPMYYAFDGADPPARTGATHATIYPYGPFKTADGVVLLGIQNEREWAVFCTKVLEDPNLWRDARFKSNSARTQQRADLTHIIEARFATMSTDSLVRKMDQVGIANGRMNDLAAVWRHPQLHARDAFTTVQSEIGPVPALRPSWLPQGMSAIMGPVPALGEHTERILAELGFGSDQIAQLRATNAI
jgi:crotonobetainyl-CoA:carnitine CoA-transferase CaiB-like acyl-CoA transferase